MIIHLTDSRAASGPLSQKCTSVAVVATYVSQWTFCHRRPSADIDVRFDVSVSGMSRMNAAAPVA